MFINLIMFDLFLMLCSWVIVTYNHRAGLVDVTWAFAIACNVLIAAFLLDHAPISVRVFLAVGCGLWFFRLAWHLLRRYHQETHEDTRYANMRRAMGKFQHLGFLLFFLFQAGLVILFSYPMLALLNASTWQAWTPWCVVLAAFIMLIAFIGEAIADQQLYRFKLDPKNKGKTLDQGLWKYSRHPNYFFEWLHWFAYPILALGAGLPVLWIYPLLMWLFLYYITGIPFSEQQALVHRGDDYRDYQRRTSMFIPRQPKK